MRKGSRPPRPRPRTARPPALRGAGDDGSPAIVKLTKPGKKPRPVNNPSQLMYDLYNDRCDAVGYDMDVLAQSGGGAERTDRSPPDRRQESPAPRSPGEPAATGVDAALSRLTRDRTLTRLQKRRLTVHVSKLAVLR